MSFDTSFDLTARVCFYILIYFYIYITIRDDVVHSELLAAGFSMKK